MKEIDWKENFICGLLNCDSYELEYLTNFFKSDLIYEMLDEINDKKMHMSYNDIVFYALYSMKNDVMYVLDSKMSNCNDEEYECFEYLDGDRDIEIYVNRTDSMITLKHYDDYIKFLGKEVFDCIEEKCGFRFEKV